LTTSKTLLAKGQIKYETEAKLVQLGGQIEMRLTGQIHANKQFAVGYYKKAFFQTTMKELEEASPRFSMGIESRQEDIKLVRPRELTL